MRPIVQILSCAWFAGFVASGATPATVSAAAGAGAAYTNEPAFNLAAGVIWKKYRKVRENYVLGKPAEGAALRLFRMGVSSRNPEIAAEAQAILTALEETREVLGTRLEQATAAGDPRALRMKELYLMSYPSQRNRFKAVGKKEDGVNKRTRTDHGI